VKWVVKSYVVLRENETFLWGSMADTLD